MATTKLLVAVSSPWASEKQAQAVVDLARRLQAQVVVAHVVEQREEDESESESRHRGEEAMQSLHQALVQAGITSEKVMLFSDRVAKAIVNTAQARACTLIVLGCSGKTRFQRWRKGDVPQEILRLSTLPVLLSPLGFNGTV